MTLSKINVNEISIECYNSILIIKYPDVTYSYWKSLIPFYNDVDLYIIMSNILVDLDCSVTYNHQRLITTSNMNYDFNVSKYYYYLLRVVDQIMYNFYLDLLIEAHTANIKFEMDNPIIEKVPIVKTKRTKKISIKDIYVRQETFDMFTNDPSYIYSNSKTGDIIHSPNPNLLEKLNAKPVKVKQTKVVGVSMDAMTFSFKKKDNGIQ